MIWVDEGNPFIGKNAFEIATIIGIASGCWMCLDAGASGSYGGTGQTWTDLSGAGCDFYRGAGVGAAADDPTFNGSAGALTANEYWSFDGGDFFTKTSANSTPINNLHKDSASFSLFAVAMLPGTGAEQVLFGTNNNAGSVVGAIWKKGTANSPRFFASNGTSAMAAASPDAATSTSAWMALGITVDEAAATGFFTKNGSYDQVSAADTFNATYASPSASNAGSVAQIGASGSGADRPANTSRLAVIAGFAPALTFAQMRAYSVAVGLRFAI